MKKLLVITVLSCLFLTACGEKNTITYDFKSNKATINIDNNKVSRSINNYSDFFREITEHCGGFSYLDLFKAQAISNGKAETEVCENGLKYKAVNFPKLYN